MAKASIAASLASARGAIIAAKAHRKQTHSGARLRKRPKKGPLIDGPTDDQFKRLSFATGEAGYETVTDGDGNITGSRAIEVYRRHPYVDTLLSRGHLDPALHDACAWYREQYELSGQGIRSCLAERTPGTSGVRGPTDAAIAGASAANEMDWARQFIPAEHRDLFDAVALGDFDYQTLAAKEYPTLKPDTGARKVGLRFTIAACRLHMGIAHRLPCGLA